MKIAVVGAGLGGVSAAAFEDALRELAGRIDRLAPAVEPARFADKSGPATTGTTTTGHR